MRQVSRLSRWLAAVLAIVAAPATAFAQGAVITGTVTSDAGVPIQAATVYITSLGIGVQTNAAGVYTLTVPAARLQGEATFLRVRAIGYRADAFEFTPAAGRLEHNFVLKTDVNRLSEVVVTGSIEGTERSKVPFAVGRLTTEDVPLPSPNPVLALAGKVPGLRIASPNGKPGAGAEIMMRGPTSINSSGRETGPLIIVDGVIMRVGNLDEIGGLDIESVEVVKGAAGASLYGTTAANGVMIIKTKRGGTQDGVRFNVRSEYGISDLSSAKYFQPENHHLGLDETGTRFCVEGAGAVSQCSRTMDINQEVLRFNNVDADTTRTNQKFQWNGPSASSGQLQNIFQANIWPGQYYNTLAQVSATNPVRITSVDATGRTGSTRFFVSGGYTDDQGAIKYLKGQQQIRGRVNLDFEARSDLLISLSSLVDQGTTDTNGFNFGSIMRGLPAGVDITMNDSLGRPIVRAGGSGIRGSGNGTTAPLYDPQNWYGRSNSQRLLANMSINYFPADWVTFDAALGSDSRRRYDTGQTPKGYRTTSVSTGTNFGNQSASNNNSSALNGNASVTIRRQLTSDIASKINIKGLYDESNSNTNASSGQQYVVKDIYTLSNTTSNFQTSSSSSKIVNMGVVGGANLDIKGKYIVDGTYRYDGSSLFGSGNRWAPFGRLSGVWRISEESYFKVPNVSDMRFRVSRGTAGNTPRFTAQYETYSCSASGCSLGQAGNSKLKPETTTEIESGVDFTLFDRVGLEITNARSTTRNQILNVPTPASLGFSNQWQNAGTMEATTWEVSASFPVITRRDLQWSMRTSFDRTRNHITELGLPEYFTGAGGGGGDGSLFLITADPTKQDGIPRNRFGAMWGRKFYAACSEMAASLQSQCGEGKAYQVNGQGWVTWVGDGNSWKDGITRNLWQTKLSTADSPWNVPIYFGMPIVDRPLRGEIGETAGKQHILGNALPSYRASYNTTLTYKRLNVYGLFDGTFGHRIDNVNKGWGVFDFQSDYFDQQGRTVEEATPVGYGWRVGSPEGAGIGGFYDRLGPNNWNVEPGTYVKLREVSVSYKVGPIAGVGDWTFGLVGRNLKTWTSYGGVDPEVGVQGGDGGSAFVNQVDAFNFPPTRNFTFSFTTRF